MKLRRRPQFQCQECGRLTNAHACPGCRSTDIDLAPLPGMATGPGTPWRAFKPEQEKGG